LEQLVNSYSNDDNNNNNKNSLEYIISLPESVTL
jgi:hypothetical protein